MSISDNAARESLRERLGIIDESKADQGSWPNVYTTITTEEYIGLRAAIDNAKKSLESIVCVEGEDAGVILLSADSPTHFDERNCQVYDLPYFSPLGGALVELHRSLDAIGKAGVQ